MWSCVKNRKRLGAYLDDELKASRREAVSAHLAECAACRAALNNLRHLAPVMHASEVPPVPTALADKVMARARTRAVRSHEEPVAWSPLAWWRMVSAPLRLAACATAILAFFLGLTMVRVGFPTESALVVPTDAVSVEGFEWFSPTPPASLESTYLRLAVNDMKGNAR
jgi:anti-sigma factor RsiW